MPCPSGFHRTPQFLQIRAYFRQLGLLCSDTSPQFRDGFIVFPVDFLDPGVQFGLHLFRFDEVVLQPGDSFPRDRMPGPERQEAGEDADGDAEIRNGFFFAVGENTFQPKIGFKTRYGMVANPFAEGLTAGAGALTTNANTYYRRVKVANLM